ncbi:MAG: putative HAD-superfamily hydrolase [Actinomycetota bacterium]|jgi:HAD superfamily hydrolase (TIGR01458 family)|nr:MAG: putative HAD-superfamily hydrolase [Actinomycetota bacterium]
MRPDGVLLDIDGVLTVSWEPIPGAAEALAWLRSERIPFRLITNTTTHARAALAATLREAGFDVRDEEVVTAVVATAAYLRTHHSGATVYVLSDGDPRPDLEGVRLGPIEEADVVVLGGACDAFSYAAINRVFQRLIEGAVLVGMHRNRYWRTTEGLQLDAGAYLRGLEEAAGVEATVCGKPEPAFFASVLDLLGAPPERALMVGDDIGVDVLGAQAVGITGVLVRTGKFREDDLARGTPDHVLDSIAQLPDLLGARR